MLWVKKKLQLFQKQKANHVKTLAQIKKASFLPLIPPESSLNQLCAVIYVQTENNQQSILRLNPCTGYDCKVPDWEDQSLNIPSSGQLMSSRPQWPRWRKLALEQIKKKKDTKTQRKKVRGSWVRHCQERKERVKRRAELRGWKLTVGGLFTLSMSLSRTGQQVVSCQWNRFHTFQETYIVLYKLFPPNNRRKTWTSLVREKDGLIFWQTNSLNGEKVPYIKTN